MKARELAELLMATPDMEVAIVGGAIGTPTLHLTRIYDDPVEGTMMLPSEDYEAQLVDEIKLAEETDISEAYAAFMEQQTAMSPQMRAMNEMFGAPKIETLEEFTTAFNGQMDEMRKVLAAIRETQRPVLELYAEREPRDMVDPLAIEDVLADKG